MKVQWICDRLRFKDLKLGSVTYKPSLSQIATLNSSFKSYVHTFNDFLNIFIVRTHYLFIIYFTIAV